MSAAAAPAFKIIPEHDELSRIERDLVFHPSPVREPRALTLQQVEQFNRDGYVKGIRVYSPAEIAEIRRYFDELLEQVLAAGGTSYSISTAHMKHGRVYDILTDPRIVACVGDLLGEDVVAWGSHFFCKMPGDGKVVHWHQDASYWPLSPSHAVTVWLAIDDADVGNGCMRYIPGSQRFGHLTYNLTEDEPGAVLNQRVEDAEQFGEPVYVELPAGQASIHSDLLLHASDPNTSSRRRCGLTLRYCHASVRAAMDWNQKGIVVRGSDSSGHWANPPRP